jgi:hypothetical protein
MAPDLRILRKVQDFLNRFSSDMLLKQPPWERAVTASAVMEALKIQMIFLSLAGSPLSRELVVVTPLIAPSNSLPVVWSSEYSPGCECHPAS